MAVSGVFLRAAQDRWPGWVIAAVSLTLLLVFGMLAYRDVDLSTFNEFPEAY